MATSQTAVTPQSECTVRASPGASLPEGSGVTHCVSLDPIFLKSWAQSWGESTDCPSFSAVVCLFHFPSGLSWVAGAYFPPSFLVPGCYFPVSGFQILERLICRFLLFSLLRGSLLGHFSLQLITTSHINKSLKNTLMLFEQQPKS